MRTLRSRSTPADLAGTLGTQPPIRLDLNNTDQGMDLDMTGEEWTLENCKASQSCLLLALTGRSQITLLMLPWRPRAMT